MGVKNCADPGKHSAKCGRAVFRHDVTVFAAGVLSPRFRDGPATSAGPTFGNHAMWLKILPTLADTPQNVGLPLVGMPLRFSQQGFSDPDSATARRQAPALHSDITRC